MEQLLKTPPGDVSLNRLSRQVFDVLAQYTAFPWPVLMAQAQRAGLDPTNLTASGLRQIIERLASGVERFTSPEHGAAVRAELQRLCS